MQERATDAPVGTFFPEESCWLERTEVWPDHVLEYGFKPESTRRHEFGAYLLSDHSPPAMASDVCLEFARFVPEEAVEPFARPRLKFWKRFDPAKLPVFARELPRELPYRPRPSTVYCEPTGLRRTEHDVLDIRQRLDLLFFEGPTHIFPELPLDLRRELRSAIAHAAQMEPSQGFPLLDYDQIEARIPLGHGRSMELSRNKVLVWGEPTDDPFERDLSIYSSEGYLYRLVQYPPEIPDPAEAVLRASIRQAAG